MAFLCHKMIDIDENGELSSNKVQSNINLKGYSEDHLFDSVRGVFIEGGPAFEGSGIFEKSHIQICVRNPNCIPGFFRPRQKIDYMQWHTDNYRSKSAIQYTA